MDNKFFTFNGKQYVVFFDNSTVKILRKENDKFLLLTDEEKNKIDSILNNESGYQYNSDKLIEIINSNNDLSNKEYLANFLQWLENAIPIDCRENFYNNLKTLKADLNLDMDFFELNTESKPGYQEMAGYNTKENNLKMNKNSLLEIWKIANSTQNPKDFFWRSYSQSLLHELAHMASSQYNLETGVSLCGFDKFPPEKESDKNRGLTEGFTEVISMAGVPGTIEIASGYYVEACLINQLIQIIGIDAFSKSYFSNLGTELLEKELGKIINNSNLSFQLFRSIEINFQIRNLKGKQGILGSIQIALLDYLKAKCEMLSEMGNWEEIANILTIYEQMMITPEKLKIMNKNSDDYEGIEESISKFKNIQEQFTYQVVNDKIENSVTK